MNCHLSLLVPWYFHHQVTTSFLSQFAYHILLCSGNMFSLLTCTTYMHPRARVCKSVNCFRGITLFYFCGIYVVFTDDIMISAQLHQFVGDSSSLYFYLWSLIDFSLKLIYLVSILSFLYFPDLGPKNYHVSQVTSPMFSVLL